MNALNPARLATILILMGACASPPDGPAPAPSGRFVRSYWSISRRQGDGGVTNRVNSPDTATGRFKDRREAKADGRLAISIEEDPSRFSRAELYLELWGGHPGVANKTVSANGHPAVPLPEVGAAEKNCTYSYPAIPFTPDQLVKGKNVFQFACEQGSTFWGHFLFEIACLRLDLREAPFTFGASVRASAKDEKIDLRLEVSSQAAGKIEAVEYVGHYTGYDENGDGRTRDWHGFTKEGKPMARIGRSTTPPYRARWDVSLLPDQPDVAVKAVIRFKDLPGITYETAPLTGIRLPRRAGAIVRLHTASDLPRPFWSRASRLKTCTLTLDEDPASVERAELHVAIWDGGKGKTEEPFTLNGRPLPVAGNGRHDLLYRIVPVEPGWLKKGANEIKVLSDTTHHGIEVLLPGPALIVRSRR